MGLSEIECNGCLVATEDNPPTTSARVLQGEEPGFSDFLPGVAGRIGTEFSRC